MDFFQTKRNHKEYGSSGKKNSCQRPAQRERKMQVAKEPDQPLPDSPDQKHGQKETKEQATDKQKRRLVIKLLLKLFFRHAHAQQHGKFPSSLIEIAADRIVEVHQTDHRGENHKAD